MIRVYVLGLLYPNPPRPFWVGGEAARSEIHLIEVEPERIGTNEVGVRIDGTIYPWWRIIQIEEDT